MSTLTKVLERNIKVIEKNADLTEGRFRLGHHLMPPVGWLNDPNGLCWYKGRYHVFFQYAPFDVEGGLKFWGHYTSEDLVDWKYEGTALYPDSPYDYFLSKYIEVKRRQDSKLQYISLYKNENNKVLCEIAPEFELLEHNAIMDTFRQLYREEIGVALK